MSRSSTATAESLVHGGQSADWRLAAARFAAFCRTLGGGDTTGDGLWSWEWRHCSRDQHILDQWWCRELISELRQRIRFDRIRYDAASTNAAEMRASMPKALWVIACRARLRKIGARDSHAVHRSPHFASGHPNA